MRIVESAPHLDHRIRPGDALATLAGGAVAASLWLPWYVVDVQVDAGAVGTVRLGAEATAWESFVWRDRLLVVIAVLLVVASLGRLAGRAVVTSATVMGLAAAGGALALTALVLRPDVVDAVEASGGSVSTGTGLVVALAGLVLAAAGAWAAGD